MCHHLCDGTSRYDAAAKVLTLILVCPVCGIERVVETLEYEPRPVSTDWTRVQRPPGGPRVKSSIRLEAPPAVREPGKLAA
jgi:hypothetical protein